MIDEIKLDGFCVLNESETRTLNGGSILIPLLLRIGKTAVSYTMRKALDDALKEITGTDTKGNVSKLLDKVF